MSPGGGSSSSWRIWVDTGGTFTDCLAVDPQGLLHRAKVLSTSSLRGTVKAIGAPSRIVAKTKWGLTRDLIRGLQFQLLGETHPPIRVLEFDPQTGALELEHDLPARAQPGATFEVRSEEEAPLLAARMVTETPQGRPLPEIELRLATTRGTNALLERQGACVALFVTQGFADVLEIGTQARSDLFALDIRKPTPIHDVVVEVPGRLDSRGQVVAELDLSSIETAARRALAGGASSAAIALLHSQLNPAHELELESFLRAVGFGPISISSRLAPFEKLLHRAQTAVVDAYLAPVIERYLSRVCSGLDRGHTRVMTSAGGLVSAGEFRAMDSLLSGPAGGVRGAAIAGRRSGFERVIAFDMGGTSTDVSRIEGDVDYAFEHEVGGSRLFAPALNIESVAAGGGSICSYDGHQLLVGPGSAGAAPGPACYGAGGPLTVTDVNLLLGRLDADSFEIPIAPEASERSLTRLLDSIEARTGARPDREAILDGLIDIADERMAGAIRRVSVRRGFDPVDHALVAFGGAGGQHACGVARRLGMKTIVVPVDAGLLSALGLGNAPIERFAERQVLASLDATERDLARWVAELETRALRSLDAEGVPRDRVAIRRRIACLRYEGQSSTVEVDLAPMASLREMFKERYRELHGYLPERRPIELESLRIVASTVEEAAPTPAAAVAWNPEADSRRRTRISGQWVDAPVFERSRLSPGARFRGPAILHEAHGAVLVENDWIGEVDSTGAIVLRHAGSRPVEHSREITASRGASHEAVELELFTNRFQSIVEEMGEMLRRTAISTNVKERLDFSCALLSPEGELVVNAPHIPVHLGALGLCVRSVRNAIEVGPGDVVITNHPAFGGSHLPDVTVITPVHEAGRLIGHVASRAHHAEIGGSVPGSMPPGARTLAEEGVVIPPTHLVRADTADWGLARRLFEAPPFPSRSVEENLADLRAAVAANHRGALALLALARAHGESVIKGQMTALRSHAGARMRAALLGLPTGRREAAEVLDDGSVLHVTIDINDGRARIDFAGTSAAHARNLNATPAIVRSVVLYVLRLLVSELLPLNEGLLDPIDIEIPRSMLNPDFPPDPAKAPALFGGNVETSQRLAGLLIKALGLSASSQGTMNNVIFGTSRFGYYETVCGGAGAGPGFHGASAVHTHMTNTRITDPEVLERRYPVRLDRFSIRRGSGGRGRWRGGDGVVRQLTFLEPMTLSVLGQNRVRGPFSLAGGEPGLPGSVRLLRSNGSVEILDSADQREVLRGDQVLLETPGGGGYGPVE